jgi:hypothetical protein
VAEPQDGPDNLEGMAFQLIVYKLTSLERAMQAIPPLLKKIVDQLEAQTKQSEVPMATYADLYPEVAAIEEQAHAAPPPVPPLRPLRRRLWHWFMQECP